MLRIVLVFFLFLFHHLHKVTLSVTMHLGLVPVHAQVAGNITAVKPEIQHNKQLVEGLYQQSQKHQYERNILQNGCKDRSKMRVFDNKIT